MNDRNSNSPSHSVRSELISFWFNQLVELSTEARSQALSSADIPDSLRAELAALIEIDAASGNSNLFAAVGQLNVAKMLPAGFDYLGLLGKEIGQYRIVELLGHGGFGYVFAAVRNKDYQQRIAIKVMRQDRQANASIVKRFELERQLLAKLQHENISRILDGGETEDGHPYFVMEYVNGLPITTYCNQRRMTVDERLKLFLQVCDAVGYAHQLGIVHRDLKPSNILVTDTGNVKLLDFGIAKVIEDQTKVDLVVTETGDAPMTPYYASPEQLRGESCTLASDVYSLGVILYEMVIGIGPNSIQTGSPHLITHRILSEQPVAPSRRLRSIPLQPHDPNDIARQRSTTRANLRRLLRGDLDNLVMMAIRKEPARRYSSAQDLGNDIQRYFARLPVRARGDSFGYIAAKYCRRNLTTIMLAAAVMVSLGFGLGALRWQHSRFEKERVEEQERRATLDREKEVNQKL